MTPRVPTPAELGTELKQARLPDRRLKNRLGILAESVARSPSSTLPSLCQTDAELEGAYRFLSNPRVHWRQVIAPHFRASALRAKSSTAKTLVVAHDSSMFHFKGERRGLGRLDQSDGFLGHFSLCVDLDRLPFGLLSTEVLIRRAPEQEERRRGRESLRWWRNIVAAERRLGATEHRAIHVADREAGSFALMSKMKSAGFRFVFRSGGHRLVDIQGLADGTQLKVESCLESSAGEIFREVPLSARDNSHHPLVEKTFPSRDARMAELRVRAAKVVLRRPSTASQSLPEKLMLNLVEVFEPDPPKGDEPIRWLLFTTEPIDSLEQLTIIVDAYRNRWVIEEYFKALKTGCSYQARQLESAHALLNAMAILIPAAWRLLLLRSVARTAPMEPAERVFSRDELTIIRSLSRRFALPQLPTVRDALLGVASLGGHLKRNGPPGWFTLSRGYSVLLSAQLGWAAAQRAHSATPTAM